MRHRALMVAESCESRHDGDEPAVHTHGSLALVCSGTGIMHMGGAWQVGPGDVFVVPDGLPHYRQDTEPMSYLGLQLCMACIPTVRWGPILQALFASIAAGACPVLHPSPHDREELERTLRALAADTAPSWEVDARMGVLTSALHRCSPATDASAEATSPLVAKALSWIARHAVRGISLVDVAKGVGRAPTHVATRVKNETGRTVGDWITHNRMAHARSVLLGSDLSIDQVAERVGYRSPSHFHRTFRRLHGMPPASWRRQHQ